MDLNGKLALVTGGAGFIGSHITDRLLREGARVRVLDNLSSGNPDNLNLAEIDLHQGDVRDDGDVRKAVEGVDIVFHHAAQINPARAVENPLEDFEINARGTVNLLWASFQVGVKKFLMASTNVYGNADMEVIPEHYPTLSTRESLLSPYAASKVCGEAYLKVFNDELGLDTVRLRYFNVYGPRQTIKSESGAVAIFTLRALAEKPIIIFGAGTRTRDFVYVGDVVEANIRAAREDAAAGGVFNVGTGIETSINQLAEQVIEAVGARVPVEHRGERSADFMSARADLALSKKVLGFEPKVQLAEGLRAYVEWCRQSGV
ncbi:MAG TPA: NAD-dependent epimerase/dehydratase family protein [Proteobacteria bacterium]|nr:NAD-dependent epimerase/dehydratase family protein [Pseudomonadota bacterium]